MKTNQVITVSIQQASTGSGPLASLAHNTARNLGDYWNTDPQFNEQSDYFSAAAITDYSGMVYDALRGRAVMRGGGHGPGQDNATMAYDEATLTPTALFTVTPAVVMEVPANIDVANGRYNDGKPTNRHTYAGLVPRGDWLHVLCPLGMPYYPPGGVAENQWGGKVYKQNLVTGEFVYSNLGSTKNTAGPYAPWSYTPGGCLDPVSNLIVITGPRTDNSGSSVWFYDPDAETFTDILLPVNTNVSQPVYVPSRDRFYVFSRPYGGSTPLPVDVCEVVPNRSNLSASTVTLLAPSGSAPVDFYYNGGGALDSVNNVIGGWVSNGTFCTYDPAANAWASRTMQVESGSSGTPNQAFQCITFLSNSGCFLLLQNDGYGAQKAMWAYRP